MKAVAFTFVLTTIASLMWADDKPPVKTTMYETSIVALAAEFKEAPGKAIAKYSGLSADGKVSIPLIHFSGALSGYEGKQLTMTTDNSVKVIVIFSSFNEERPESYSVTGIGRFKEFKNDTVYLLSSDVKFGQK